MHGSVVRSWLLELAAPGVQGERPGPRAPQGLRRRFGRGPLDGPGGDRPRRPGAGDHAVAADPLPLAPGRLVRREGAGGPAQRVRRPRGEDRVTEASDRDGAASARDAGARPSAPGETRRRRAGDRAGQDAPPRAAAEGRAADDARAPPRAATSASRHRSRRTTRSARAFASSASRTPAPSSCSGRPATSPIARSSRRCTSCGGRTSCRTSSSSSRSAGATTTTSRSGPSIRASLEKYSRVLPLDEAAWRSFASRIRYQRCDFADAAGFDELAKTPRGDRPGAEQPRQPPLLPRDPAVGSSPRSSPSWAGSGSTTSGTRAAGAGSSSRSRSATT